MLRNLVLLLSMITSAGGGWWLGSWSGRDAKSALAEAEVKGKLAAAEHDKAQQALNQKIAALTDEFQRESQKLKDSQTQREKDFDAVVANRDARLAELAKVHDGNQKRLAVLQAQLAVAKTPEEREKQKLLISAAYRALSSIPGHPGIVGVREFFGDRAISRAEDRYAG